MKKVKLEQVNLLTIYKENGNIYAKQPEEIIDQFELYGFLKLYLKDMEHKLLDTFEDI